jgi:hypothetical protein
VSVLLIHLPTDDVQRIAAGELTATPAVRQACTEALGMHTHEHRLAVARRRSAWELGDPSWADLVLDAYLDPETATDELDAADAPPADEVTPGGA